MLKLLILNKDLEQLKIYCNNIFNEVPDCQISGLATTMEEFDNLFDKFKPNVIMMDYSDFINSKYFNNPDFKKQKLILYNTTRNLKNSTKRIIIYPDASLKDMKKSIIQFISRINENLIRKKIIKWLEHLHFDFKLLGTGYFIESVLYCYEHRTEYVIDNLQKNVYPVVAKKSNTTAKNIKWSITRSIKNMNSHFSVAEKKLLSENFHLYISKKVTAKQLISILVTKLD